MMIKLEELVKNYGQTKAVDSLSLSVEEGELFAFLGPNGAGKTTTIRILNSLTVMTSGLALINGLDLTRESLTVKRLCGLVPQANNLDSDLSVAENLDIHGRLFSMPGPARRERAAELLAYVEMSDRRNSLVKTLSGGLKRRLMVARALMHQPRLLFLDEPTVGLDPAIRRRIWELIRKVRQDGVTIFLTTHYIEEAEALADRVAFIHHGRLVALDTPKAIISEVGTWAIERLVGPELVTTYFKSREEAKNHAQLESEAFTLRRVHLEDAFLALTGKKVK
jgi:ABC-2 type transport system ATP-binding protein